MTPRRASAGRDSGVFRPGAPPDREYSSYPFGAPATSIDLTTTFENIAAAAERVNPGDLGHLEGLLTAHAVALNAMFVSLARRADVTRRLDHEGHYLKLAFKAQSQCRATVEQLAEMKTPAIFTRQANITAQQVVNNETVVTASRAREIEYAPKELLETHGERLDGQEAGQTIESHPALEAVGALHRAKDR